MSVATSAKTLYERELKGQLETSNNGQFVAIEPLSKDYFISDTFVDAALAARAAHPDRKSFVIRVGHDAAFHIGSTSR